MVFSLCGGILLGFLFISLLSYNPADPAWSHVGNETAVSNVGGRLGAWFADLLRAFFGLGAWFFVVVLAYELARLWWKRAPMAWALRVLAYAFLSVLISTTFAHIGSVMDAPLQSLGGVTGMELQKSLLGVMGAPLTTAFLLLMSLVVATLTFDIRWGSVFAGVIAWISDKKKSSDEADFNEALDEPAADDFEPAELTVVSPQRTEYQAHNHDGALASFLAHSGLREDLMAQKQAEADEEARQAEQAAVPLHEPHVSPEYEVAQDVQADEYVDDSQAGFDDVGDDFGDDFDGVSAADEPNLTTDNTPVNATQPNQSASERFAHIAAAAMNVADTTHQPSISQSSVSQSSISQPNASQVSTPQPTAQLTNAEQGAQQDDWQVANQTASQTLSYAPSPAEINTQAAQTKSQTSLHEEAFAGVDFAHLQTPADDAWASETANNTANDTVSDVASEPDLADNADDMNDITPAAPSVANVPNPAVQNQAVPSQVAPSQSAQLTSDTPAQNTPARPAPRANVQTIEELLGAKQNAKSHAFNTLEYRMSLTPVPELSLLDPAQNKQVVYTQDELAQLSELLEIKLQEFRIQGSVVSASVGPVVTSFEVDLAPGVRVDSVMRIERDLARSLAMESLRVLDSIPGKPYIGIEVPNRKRQTVKLIELLETSDYKDPNAGISMAIGVDTSGKPIIADLAKAPHMLVAGTTGSGKSVLVNSLIMSMLLKYTPDELRLLFIDPKQVELMVYSEIPHLLTPVITDMSEATAALTWCVTEMERRYKLLSMFRVRQLKDYNEIVSQAIADGRPILDPLHSPDDSVSDIVPRLKPLPKIVVVADEFADMIMQIGKPAEEQIVRIAQKARAVGIHLILATQRPVADVVTGLIKSNVPSRVALKVNDSRDSKIAIDTGGAENMLGHGDMLFLGPGKLNPERAHGAYVTDQEVNRVADAWRERGVPDYIDLSESYTFEGEGSGNTSTTAASDEEMIPQAYQFFTETDKISISALQRRFSIGYNRAARIVDLMEEQGYISPSISGKRHLLR
ncbi:hypothetical protein B0181_07160 [Moraxella caviae]|uniref:DNA translocase FtsK n=1 Tax=Moraxella caviae TaxID=34060 RepID=A0A1T0A166_9GAMM|nr:hypothetical protein B0181_07160 [Moraxella caviae]